MEFKLFIGIDMSKSSFDVYFRNYGSHAVFPNNREGFDALIEWVVEKSGGPVSEETLFAFEHTGLYSFNLAVFLEEKNYCYTLIPGLEFKRSRGITRGKSDKADAKGIAEYAYEKREKIKLYRMPSKTLVRLKKLLSYRERMVKERAAYQTRQKEYKEFLDQDGLSVLFSSHQTVIECLDGEIGKVEKELYRLIKEDENLYRQYKLITSIKGVGPQTAMLMIVLTNGFGSFEKWRKFASYAGIAPFPNQSGLFKGRTKINNLANKRIKALLSCCAASAIQYNPEMKLYYQRRISEGKNAMSTLNIIRNKILSRIFAVVQRETPYVEIYKYAA